MMGHDPRPRHESRCPVQVTLRAIARPPSLRSNAVFPAVRRSLARSSRAGFRVVHYSVQQDHVHLIVEADGRSSLQRGVQGLAIRVALAVNRALQRSGRFWGDRYHARELGTPREVRASMVYVLLNFRKHLRAAPGIDPRSSGPSFAGWRGRPEVRDSGADSVSEPRTWLARVGWLRAGGHLAVGEGGATADGRIPRLPSSSKGVLVNPHDQNRRSAEGT
jgi:REP element-mobilizing transposase RayT